MSAHRIMKQTVYGLMFWVGLVCVLILVILPFLPKKQAAPVVVASPVLFNPLIIESVVAIPHIEHPGPLGKTVDVVARLRNDNARAGTGNYPVQFLLYDAAGTIIQTVSQDVYVLPGGIQYIAALDMQVPANATFDHADVTASKNTQLSLLPDTARLPDFSVFLRDRTHIMSGVFPLEQQTGIVTNNSTFDWEKVSVVSVALDASGKIIGVGKTFVGKLLVGEQREFTLQWPQPEGTTSRVIAIATTDIYSDANFVHIIGDSSKLR